MSGLLGPNGKPISSSDFAGGQFKKATPPPQGEAFGSWAGRDLSYLQLPGGGSIGFDLNGLTLADYRKMTSHYQIHSSLAVLSFLLHQSEWRIECEDKKIAAHCQQNMEEIWTQLTRAFSTSNWAGFAPNVLQWENDAQKSSVQLAKVKDLIPEECVVNWKEVEGYAPRNPLTGLKSIPPKYKIYDGIKQIGTPYPIPVEATTWYPLLMEHGDYYGKKLLKPAFTSWYFSILLHLFANRYYERFGEPTPIGRAPMDDTVTVGTGDSSKDMNSRDYMLGMLNNIRSRSVVVLPNDKNPTDMSSGTRAYDYEIEYLESQMRGADFERYMTRLDEEMSIGLFTPILLLRTADVGSYNLGVGHMQVYLWMLNALNGDRKFYIDNYILNRMVDYNFSPNAPRAKIVFRKMGNSNSEMISAVLQALVSSGKVGVDLDQLGELAGLTLKQVRDLTAPEADPAPDDTTDDGTGDSSADDTATTATEIKNRLGGQVAAAFEKGTWASGLKLDMGFQKKLRTALFREGADVKKINRLFETMDMFTRETVGVPFDDAGQYMTAFSAMLDAQIDMTRG